MAVARKNEMFSFTLYLICVMINCVVAVGRYSIEYAPNYVTYLPTETSIDLSEIPLVIKSSFGFSTEQDFRWNGLSQGNPFKRPKAHVLFSVESSGELSSSETSFTVKNDVGDVNTEGVSEYMKDAMSDRSIIFDFSQQNTMFDMQSRHPSVFGHIPTTTSTVQAILTTAQDVPFTAASLNVTVKQDLTFLSQMYLVNAIADALAAHSDLSLDAYPDFYHFRLDGLKGVLDKYGAQSTQVKDAEHILRTSIHRISGVMQEAYSGSVVIQVVTYDVNEADLIKLRSIRSLQATRAAGRPQIEIDLNVADGYDSTYSIIFNIIVWGMIILAITVYGVSYGIWNMDPGHDSIIYRMTSQRLKRD